MIRLENVTKSYKGDTVALRDASTADIYEHAGRSLDHYDGRFRHRR
jgi:hypothetical protein